MEGSYFWMNWSAHKTGHRGVSKRLNIRLARKRLRAAGSFGNTTSKNGNRTLQKWQSDLHFIF